MVHFALVLLTIEVLLTSLTMALLSFPDHSCCQRTGILCFSLLSPGLATGLYEPLSKLLPHAYRTKLSFNKGCNYRDVVMLFFHVKQVNTDTFGASTKVFVSAFIQVTTQTVGM